MTIFCSETGNLGRVVKIGPCASRENTHFQPEKNTTAKATIDKNDPEGQSTEKWGSMKKL
jgi:hypothetical protein